MSLFLWRLLIGVAALGALTSGPGAKAAPSLVGTLTCTAEAAPSDNKKLGGWKLSCAFAQAGTSTVQHYGGEITGIDQGTRKAGAKALFVWTVVMTKWPVSAAVSASSIVSKSRNSPTRITSGSSRSAARSATANELVCWPTSRCVTKQLLFW